MSSPTGLTPEQRLDALLAARGVHVDVSAASRRELAHAQALAPLPRPLAHLYEKVDLLRIGGVELFQVDDYIDVNTQRRNFEELSDAIFVGSDLAEGWFFVDPIDFMGLGAGFVFWCERGALVADDCVPAAPSLIDLLEIAARGESPWRGPMLGDRAVSRLSVLLEQSPAVATRPPVDPALFHEPGHPQLTLRMADLLMQSNGILLPASQRELSPYEAMQPVAGSAHDDGMPGAVWVGHGPHEVRYATTSGNGWLGLPADRLLAVAPGVPPEAGTLLGRTADVWARWIEDDQNVSGG